MATGVSQLMVALFLGNDPDTALNLIHTYRPAVLTLYPDNLSGQPKQLMRTLHEADPNLLAMIDQEGGHFHSYRSLGIARFPSLQTLGAANSTELAFQAGKDIGEEVLMPVSTWLPLNLRGKLPARRGPHRRAGTVDGLRGPEAQSLEEKPSKED